MALAGARVWYRCAAEEGPLHDIQASGAHGWVCRMFTLVPRGEGTDRFAPLAGRLSLAADGREGDLDP